MQGFITISGGVLQRFQIYNCSISLDELFALYGKIAERVEHCPTRKYRNQFAVERTAQPSFTLTFLGRAEVWKTWQAKYSNCPELPIEKRMKKPGYPLPMEPDRLCGQCQFSERSSIGYYCQKHQQHYSIEENPAPHCQQFASAQQIVPADRIARVTPTGWISTTDGKHLNPIHYKPDDSFVNNAGDFPNTDETPDSVNQVSQPFVLGLAEVHYAVRKFSALNDRSWDEAPCDEVAAAVLDFLAEY